MNIAIVIGVSEYSTVPIPAPRKDANRIKQLLDATGRYEKILHITENTVAATVKEQIRSFLHSFHNQKIEKVFYYFSGHGILEDQEFYMLCSDYEKSKRSMTSLQNSEIDSFIRILSPGLTVKVLDACFSGYRYVKDDAFSSTNNFSLQGTLGNVIFMASCHDDQQSQMMGVQSFFTEKFIEGTLSTNIGGKVLYRDIQAFIADEFRSMTTQIPFFTTQGTNTEMFAEYTEAMQALREEWYPEPSEEMLDEDLPISGQDPDQAEIVSHDELMLAEIDKLLTRQNAFFIEEDVVNSTLNNIKESILNYQVSDRVVNAFYQIHLQWDKRLQHLAKNDGFLRTAVRERWSQKYFILIDTKTVRTQAESWAQRMFGSIYPPDYTVTEEPVSLYSTHELPYEVIWIEFQPIDKLSLSPLLAIIGLVHSETHVLAFFNKSTMTKQGWRHFDINWNSLEWTRREFLWKEVVEHPNILWEEFLDEVVQELKTKLVKLFSVARDSSGRGRAVADVNEFTSQVLELSEKLGVPIEEVLPQQAYEGR